MITKEEFVNYMNFIKEKQNQQNTLCTALEQLAPTFRCDAMVYWEYEEKLIGLLEKLLDDKDENIKYKLYEFDDFNNKDKEEQLKETPYLESWETLYDYLVGGKVCLD